MNNISLETSLSWLSDDIVRFKIEVGVGRNVQKCNVVSHAFSAHDTACHGVMR